MPCAKRLSHSHGDLRLRFDYLGSHFLCFSAHLLLNSNRCCSAHLGFRLRDALVCLGLFGLQFRADVIAHVHVGDVDRENLERGIAIEAFSKNRFRDAIGIFQHFLVRVRRTNRAHDAFTDSRDNRLLGCATDESIEMRAHRDARFDLYADTILRDTVNR